MGIKLKDLKTKFLGKENIYYDEIDSTQKEIWRRIDNKIENGLLVIAGIQKSGIGTHGRRWYTDCSNNIAFSFYIEANCVVEKLNGLTVQIAEIIKTLFLKLYNVNLQIKEPNDLYYNNKKIGGILTESKVCGNIVKFLVIGIGINTSQTNFREELDGKASSIKNEFNINVDEKKVITEFCNCFEKAFLERVEK